MSFEPNPKQALCLLGILFGQSDEEREPMQSKVRPELKPKERAPLIAAGLLEAERRGQATHLIATDAAWEWASTHLDAELMPSRSASPILHNILTQLGKFLAQKGLALADIVTLAGGTASDDSAGNPGQNDEGDTAVGKARTRIRDAVLSLGGGRSKQRVRLSALRSRLPEVPRVQLDSLLLKMQSEQQLVLYRLDNPTELGPADEDAALLVGGNPRHLVYLEG